jgi:1-acyl-sn-glycerol-3-phosphate acyltransferase
MRKVWAAYGIVVFFLLLFILFPLYYLAFLLLPKSWRKYSFWFNHHVFTAIYLTLIGVRVRVAGKNKLHKNQTYIIVSNHISLLDFIINAHSYPGIYKYLAKKELGRVPLFGFIVRKHCVLVDRTSASSRAASLKFLGKTLDDGYSVFLYPEGTRNRSSEPLLPFHKGAFKIAIESGNPLAVQTIVGIDKVAGRGNALEMWPGLIDVKWSDPIQVKHLTMNDVDALIEKVRQLMLAQLKN